MDMVTEGVVVGRRIPVLERFYVSGSVPNATVLEEKWEAAGPVSEDSRGQWCTQQLERAAEAMNLMAVIKADGDEVPVVPQVEAYHQAYLEVKKEAVLEAKENLPRKQRRAEYAARDVELADALMTDAVVSGEEAAEAVEEAEAKLREVQSLAGTESDLGKAAATEAAKELEAAQAIQLQAVKQVDLARKAYEVKYRLWEDVATSIRKDKELVETITKEAVRDGTKQHAADTDACQRMQNALAECKRFLTRLMAMDGMRFVGEVVRQAGPDGRDPYKEGDMRRCLANLRARYYKSDELGVATTLMVGMREVQLSESLGTYMRRIEGFLEDLDTLGVKEISVKDLVAMVALSGMKADSRKRFLESEAAVAITLSNLGDGDLGGGSECGSVTDDGSRRSGKGLIDKVRAFVRSEEDGKLMMARFGGVKLVETEEKRAEAMSAKEAKKRVAEAQLAFAAAVRKSDARACFEWAKSGKCSRGDACRFTHDQTCAGGPPGGGGGGGASGIGGASGGGTAGGGRGPCFNWQSTGTCRFGNACKFEHGKVEAVVPAQAVAAGGAAAPKPPPAASKLLFAGQKGKQSWNVEEWSGDEADIISYVVEVVEPVKRPAACGGAEQSIPVFAVDMGERLVLGWDSMSQINVAKSLEMIPGAKKLRQPKKAVGIGGARAITHAGKSPIFGGLDMVFIEGGGTPNLQSVGRAVQRDASGRPAVAIFSEAGAVRVRMSQELQDKIAALVEEAGELGLVEGTAVLRDYVYEEEFGPGVTAVVEGEKVCAVSSNLFASRIRLSTPARACDFFAAAGVGRDALEHGQEHGSIRGLPASVTPEQLSNYYKYAGQPSDQAAAAMVTAGLRKPIDYEADGQVAPGEILQIDNVDPSFSRLVQAIPSADRSSSRAAARMPVPSIGGYRDAVVIVDQGSGAVKVVGRESKKNPHVILSEAMDWSVGRWARLSVVKCDAEFVTRETVNLANRRGVRIRQAVPGDHRRTLGLAESVVRYIQELGQGFMNQLRHLVKDGDLTKLAARSLWFHALRQAVFAFNLRPALNDPTKTRYEVATGEVANLSYMVMMPFGMKLMGRDTDTGDGRGSEYIYIGPSATVRGGILTYSLKTGRVSVKYSFAPMNHVVRPTLAEQQQVRKLVYGKARGLLQAEEVQEDPNAGSPVVRMAVRPVMSGRATELEQGAEVDTSQRSGEGATLSLCERDLGGEEEGRIGPTNRDEASAESLQVGESDGMDAHGGALGETQGFSPAVATLENGRVRKGEEAGGVSEGCAASGTRLGLEQDGGGQRDLPRRAQRGKSGGGVRPPVVSNYGTRSRGATVLAIIEEEGAVLAERPPKPQVPSRAQCEQDPAWIAAGLREAKKLMDEDTLRELPKDEKGRYIRPEGAVVLPILKIKEFKWKPDPETGVERWLECVRYVCDGSADKRSETVYAETPDRTLLFIMTSLDASMGIEVKGSDVERAYLNAESLDRNIVIVAPRDVVGLPKESLLIKGLYGTKKGALGWQVWIDTKLVGRGFRKLAVARGVYRKDIESGVPMLLLRHSDDLRTSSKDAVARSEEEAGIKSEVRMADFANLDRFLGCTFERINARTGKPSVVGTIVLVRQCDKIKEMAKSFAHLREKYNPRGRVREAALPSQAIKDEGELDEANGRLLSELEKKDFQSLVGGANWVVNSTRPDAKLAVFLVSTRLSCPRVWDMFLAVWMLDYLVATVETPLVLGGSVIDPEVWADASLAILPERRSIVAHVATTGRGSGAVYAHVGSTKVAVTNIWEAELMAGCEAMNTGLYITKACEDMGYPVSACRNVWVDNQAEIEWVRGTVSNRRSRHIDVRYYRSRHLQEEGDVHLQYVKSEDNMADLLTKPLPVPHFRRLAAMMLGHGLCEGLGVSGLLWESGVATDTEGISLS